LDWCNFEEVVEETSDWREEYSGLSWEGGWDVEEGWVCGSDYSRHLGVDHCEKVVTVVEEDEVAMVFGADWVRFGRAFFQDCSWPLGKNPFFVYNSQV
jgi:hypothetical protein